MHSWISKAVSKEKLLWRYGYWWPHHEHNAIKAYKNTCVILDVCLSMLFHPFSPLARHHSICRYAYCTSQRHIQSPILISEEWVRERERGLEKKLLFNSIHVHVLSSHSPLSMSLVNIFEFYLNILCVSIPICSERYREQWLSKELISHSTCARVAHSFILWGANSLFASHQQFVIFFRKQYYAIAFGEQ